MALYADQDGYELCLSDEGASTESCVSSYRLGAPMDTRTVVQRKIVGASSACKRLNEFDLSVGSPDPQAQEGSATSKRRKL